MEWWILGPRALTGLENMAVDLHLADLLSQGEILPTLRLYTWEPWAISLGCHQRADSIDMDCCIADGIDVVRRPTGGRAVFHAEELTYSVVMRTERRTILEVYNDVSRSLARGLRFLGVPAELVSVQEDFRGAYRRASSVMCFSSSALHEVQVGGKKLVGSAQRRFEMPDGNTSQVILQHGSILIGSAHRRLPDYVRTGDEQRSRMRTEIESKSTEIETELGRSVTIWEVADAVRRGFEDEWGIRFSVPEQCDELVERLAGVDDKMLIHA